MAETDGRLMVGPLPIRFYDAVRERLDNPSRRVIGDVASFFHPHTPPEHADYPTPTNGPGIVRLLEAVELRQRMVLGVTALEFIAPTWDQLLIDMDREAPDFPGVPRLVDETWRWIRGDDVSDVLDDMEDQVRLRAEPPADFGAHPDTTDEEEAGESVRDRRAVHLYMTILHAVFALRHANSARDRGYVTLGFGGAELAAVEPLQFAISHAARAFDPEAAPPAFLARWWRRCRCRLAWNNSDDSEFE